MNPYNLHKTLLSTISMVPFKRESNKNPRVYIQNNNINIKCMNHKSERNLIEKSGFNSISLEQLNLTNI